MFNLLPLAALTSVPPQPVELHSQDVLEQRLYASVHDALAGGWKLTSEDDEAWGVSITLTKGDAAMQLVANLDQLSLLSQSVPVVKDTFDATMASMLASPRGGLVIDSECGMSFVRSYVIEDEARGRAAQKLVASTLAGADDLESANVEDGLAELDLTRGNDAISVYADLDDHGHVQRAEVRRWNVRADLTTYQRMDRMTHALDGRRVTAIVGDETDLTLVLGKQRYVIDPDGDAFHVDDQDEDGC
jgi:hypothetical protein